jgi:hypothetical protein
MGTPYYADCPIALKPRLTGGSRKGKQGHPILQSLGRGRLSANCGRNVNTDPAHEMLHFGEALLARVSSHRKKEITQGSERCIGVGGWFELRRDRL